ncbi:PKD domain-containing protein [Cellulosimicrobium terreum]|nr:PKD domain-containing protein [Cellulosimicrobium terreum]
MFNIRALTSFAAALALGLAGVVVPAGAASADEAVAPLPETVSADGLPTVQIDGVVWKQVIVGNTVYVGGNFQNARPAGAAPGTNLVPRTHLLAYNLSTGVLDTSFNHTLNGDVTDMAASPDGKRLYIVGGFTTIDGQTRNRIAGFELPSGALSTSFVANSNGNTKSVAATNTRVYAGGYFSAMNGATRYRMAAMNASNGSVVPGFVPRVDDRQVQSIVVAPDEQSVVISGSFTSVNGSNSPGYGLARLDAATGASVALPINSTIRNGGDSASIMRLSTDGTSFYGVGWDYNGGGTLEGTFAANWSDGAMKWIEDCHGDTYDVANVNGVVYTASHKHYCGNSGGFPQTNPWTYYHSTAFSGDVRGTNTADIYGYADHPGTPRPELLNWFPYTEWGSYTSAKQSVWTVTGNSGYVLYGGEFPQVNGVRQQGLVRYAVRSNAPNKVGPAQSGEAINPSVQSVTAGKVRVGFRTTWDKDDIGLTYKVFRDNETSSPIFQETISTPFWKPLTRSVTDSGLTAGASHRYRLVVSDPSNNIVRSEWISVTVSATTASPYAEGVLDDGATSYWRLGEPSGSTGFDWAGGDDLTLSTGVSRGAAGAVNADTNTATTFNGTSNGRGAGATATTGPNTFSAEAWIKTSTTRGGKIVGFGNQTTGDSSNYDRHVYMTNNGKLVFGVYNNAVSVITSPASYNDNAWHHVVATLGANGMQLYVDGKRVAQRADVTSGQSYSGYWRVGGDNLNSWTSQPTSSSFAGTIDEVAIYGSVLSTAKVRAHFTASGRTLAVPARPADAYGRAVYDADPDVYWRYDETSGTDVADSGTYGNPAKISGSYSRNVAGALSGGVGKGITFTTTTCQWWQVGCTAATGGNVYSTASVANPTTYSLETWFKTTSTAGGKIIGFGSSQTGGSGNYDRHVYMQDDGKLVFGTYTGVTNTITTSGAYNNGAWHHVVATQGPNGMRLYVDGQSAGSDPQASAQDYSGYWRVGGDTTWGSSSSNLLGSFDETAIYSRVLSAADAASHFGIGTTGQVPNQAPTARFASEVTKLAVAFDASTSSDSDGTVASYAWDFGDGESGTGAEPEHTYDEPGTYTVTLVVTDDDGATGTVSHDVVAVANVAPVAAFSSSVSKLKASFDAGDSSDADGSVESYAWDFGDGDSGSGATTSHTYDEPGTFDVRLTVTDDDGATKSLTKPVTVTANGAPEAEFSSTVAGLKVTVDGSGSSDADGSVESYAWDFGDGESGTGATTSHTYDDPGTYEVTLTVTDDEGATGELSKDVTVSAATVFAQDAFGRSVSSGWGTADTGGDWALWGGATPFNVAGGVGTLRLASAGSGPKAQLQTVSARDVELRGEFSLDKIADGGGTFVSFTGRTGGFSSEYRTKVWVKSTGAVQLQLVSLQSSETTLSAANIAGLSVTAGETLKVRAQLVGASPTTFRAKVWKAGTDEPSNWQLTTTNSVEQLQDAGGVGVATTLSGSATTGASIVSFDNLWAGPLG